MYFIWEGGDQHLLSSDFDGLPYPLPDIFFWFLIGFDKINKQTNKQNNKTMIQSEKKDRKGPGKGNRHKTVNYMDVHNVRSLLKKYVGNINYSHFKVWLNSI